MVDVQNFSERVIGNIEKVIVGKRQTVELAVVGLLCQGHLLIEDVPGVAIDPGDIPDKFNPGCLSR